MSDEIRPWDDDAIGASTVIRSLRCPRCEICYPLTQTQVPEAHERLMGRSNCDKPDGRFAWWRYGSCLVCGHTTSTDDEFPISKAELAELEMDAFERKAFERAVMADVSAIPSLSLVEAQGTNNPETGTHYPAPRPGHKM